MSAMGKTALQFISSVVPGKPAICAREGMGSSCQTLISTSYLESLPPSMLAHHSAGNDKSVKTSTGGIQL